MWGRLTRAVDHVERVVELAELMVDEGVGGEAFLGQPGPVKPVAVERPLEEARLDDGDRDAAVGRGHADQLTGNRHEAVANRLDFLQAPLFHKHIKP